VQSRIKQYIADRIIVSKQKAEHVEFFIKNSDDSLQSARCLFDVSTKHDYPGYDDLTGFLWVINASYYSMFYMARALLEHAGIKLKAELSIHALIFDAVVYYFYLTGKLEKQLFEYYVAAKEDVAELLGQQRAGEMIQEYFYEKRKRATFTYETGKHAMENKAKTSLQRAIKFNKEIRGMINEK
jgi:uncharacterized protein (UPF0332 family)